MLLTKQEFDTQLSNKNLRLSLIGMSGMGKSYRAKQLAGIGFTHICCDDLIEQRLDTLPSIGIAGVANWMGQPYEDRYPSREKEYLSHEAAVTYDALQQAYNNNIVLDTTGSVIYLADSVLNNVHTATCIVYLEANQHIYDKLFKVYMSDPKPVIWGDKFSQTVNENSQQALQRCYPELLQWRSKQYAKLADVTLSYTIARAATSPNEFLQAIRNNLPA